MCAHMAAADYHTHTIQACFDETTIWEDDALEPAIYDLAAAKCRR